jgi:hypothetical protein
MSFVITPSLQKLEANKLKPFFEKVQQRMIPKFKSQ